MRVIELTKGQVAIVDDEDFGKVAQWRWKLSNKGYASRTDKRGGKSKVVFMHRLVLDAPEGAHVDHINGNPLDNRRCNLRLVNRFQNQQNRGKNRNNTSGYKGVTFSKKERKWLAQITANGKALRIAVCNTPEEAALAYNEASARLHGEYGYQNVVPNISNN